MHAKSTEKCLRDFQPKFIKIDKASGLDHAVSGQNCLRNVTPIVITVFSIQILQQNKTHY